MSGCQFFVRRKRLSNSHVTKPPVIPPDVSAPPVTLEYPSAGRTLISPPPSRGTAASAARGSPLSQQSPSLDYELKPPLRHPLPVKPFRRIPGIQIGNYPARNSQKVEM